MDCICFTKVSFRGLCKSKLRAKNVTLVNGKVDCNSNFNIIPKLNTISITPSKCSASFKVTAKVNQQVNLIGLKVSDNFNIKNKTILSGVVRANLTSNSKVRSKYTAKIGGSLANINSYVNTKYIEKLYPT